VLDLAPLGDAAGFVIDDGQPAVAEPVDAVGRRGHGERPTGRRNDDAALGLADALGNGAGAAHYLLADEPAGNALETGPPECPSTRPRQHRAEHLTADFEALVLGRARQIPRKLAHEFRQRLMHRDAEFGAAGVLVDLVE